MTFHHVLIAVDGTPISAHAAEIGIELARSLGGGIALIHVVEPTSVYAADDVSTADVIAMAEQDGKRLLAEFRARATLQAPPLEFLVIGGAAAEIVNCAKSWPAEIIVVGRHGRSGLSRMVLGSVAEEVMRHAPCPVLTVQAQS